MQSFYWLYIRFLLNWWECFRFSKTRNIVTFLHCSPLCPILTSTLYPSVSILILYSPTPAPPNWSQSFRVWGLISVCNYHVEAGIVQCLGCGMRVLGNVFWFPTGAFFSKTFTAELKLAHYPTQGVRGLFSRGKRARTWNTKFFFLLFFFCGSTAQHGLRRFIVEVSRSHTHTHTRTRTRTRTRTHTHTHAHTQAVGPLWMIDQVIAKAATGTA
jgi:hypothetical protein